MLLGTKELCWSVKNQNIVENPGSIPGMASLFTNWSSSGGRGWLPAETQCQAI